MRTLVQICNLRILWGHRVGFSERWIRMLMDLIPALAANLLSPAVLFFVLGVIATLVSSDLRFPEPLYLGLTIYLLVAIGFKGGVALSAAGLGQVWLPGLAAMA
jgi:hypothetical protein